KCLAKISAFRAAKKSPLLVSLGSGAVARVCEGAMRLEEGLVGAEGSPHHVVDAYHQKVGEKEQRERAARGEIGARWGSKEIEITSARVVGPDGAERVVLESGQPAAIEIGYRNPKGVSD